MKDFSIKYSYFTQCDNIKRLTIHNGKVIDFEFKEFKKSNSFFYNSEFTALFLEEVCEKNSTSFFNQTTKIIIKGKDEKEKEKFKKTLLSLKTSCCTVWVHFYDTENIKIQGIDVDPKTGEWRFSKERALVKLLFDYTKGLGEKLECVVKSVSSCSSSFLKIR